MSDSSNTSNQADLNKKLGELGDIITSKLKENGQETESADSAIKGVQSFINDSYAKVENADDKEGAKNDIVKSILGKVEQFSGKNEVNKGSETKND